MKKRSLLLLFGPLLLSGSVTGCIAAAGAAAGAAGAVAYSERGARSEVAVPVDSLLHAVEATFAQMSITVTERSRKEDGTEHHLKAKNGDTEINVDIDQDQPPTTRIQITARKNLVDYDREYARDILKRVLERIS
jgi:hypothetical protein